MKVQDLVVDTLFKALKNNKYKYINHEELEVYKTNPSFIYVGTYANPDWQLTENEVGIDGDTLERLVLKI